MNIFDK
jgi:hypothetical protein